MMKYVFILLVLIPLTVFSQGTAFFVSPGADGSGDGSWNYPWQLQQALNHPPDLQPGDTVWLLGGVYENAFDPQTSFSCFTNGTFEAPIIFRNYKQERATIDGNLFYSLYVGNGNCSYTWFWGIEVTNSSSLDRNHNIPGGITCTAENIRFINMIVHDTGSGIDAWKTAKNTEIYGCVIYHIGNNLNNNGNLEGHGHGMYLQNDTFGTKRIHNNIVFSTYGHGINIWQTTTTAALGNFDLQRNIVFNGGSASENLGGVGNNSRTHNIFAVSNGANNPLVNTVIAHNYTFSGKNIPRPPVNAFGLNAGVKNMKLDSNILTGQTRLGFNNTPVFDATVSGNSIISGIPPAYGYYLWGFTMEDFPGNDYFPMVPEQGLEYRILPNQYETDKAHVVIYNWDSLAIISLDVSILNFKQGDHFSLVNVMDLFNDTIRGVIDETGMIEVPMTGHTFVFPTGSEQLPSSQFPQFGAFILMRSGPDVVTTIERTEDVWAPQVVPNPSTGRFYVLHGEQVTTIEVTDGMGCRVFYENKVNPHTGWDLDVSFLPKGIYFIRMWVEELSRTHRIVLQ